MRNTLWNLLGAGLPILLALVTIPVLIHNIGTARFGVLAIAWVVLGYFGLFDFGLGGATTKFLAEAFEHERVVEGRALFWTSLILNWFLGLVGAVTLAALTPLLVSRVLNIPAALHSEALAAFYLIACSVPIVTVMTVLRGTLEAQHRFGLLNVLQVPISTLNQVAPLLVLPFSSSLTVLVGVLVLSRLVEMIVFLVVTLRQLHTPFVGPFFLPKRLKKLFSYGGWLTVTNVVGPLMVYSDRFIIGSLSSMTAVAYYATPYQAVTRLWILPHSLMRVVFPIFSAMTEARQRTEIYANAIKHLTLVLAPVIATAIVFAPDLLRLWVGETFVENSTLVLQILAIGVFINSLALTPYSLIQGLGRPDITAKFHLLELPFYLLFLYYGVQRWGIAGAAVAWTVRVGVDALLLVFYVRLTGRLSSLPTKGNTLQALALALLLISSGWLLHELTTNSIYKLVVWGLLLSIALVVVWRKLLTSGEREKIIGYGKRILWGNSERRFGEAGK